MGSLQIGHSRVSARFARLIHGDAASVDVDATMLLYSCALHLDAGSSAISGTDRLLRLAILRDKISLYRMGVTCMARYEVWSVIDATCEENQGMLEGGC